ncbi:hypothetical protein [Mesorhizobium sp. B2-6-5]|uniref:hypothetical protein n=1 Tax=Mesorhizobium sp. B2-6-5 TaxID=2589912 RepID=UPI00112BBDC4|nr:hypothetical protein [Mesorhizobium sp. B2-6-5]TPJ34258.1 hypothetical protein FJ432_30000 [Mesorhizobium sp. B2-6-5]
MTDGTRQKFVARAGALALDPQLEAYVAAAEAALADLRRYVRRDPIAIVQERPAPFPEPERRDELLGKEWIEIGAAAGRFSMSKDTIWRWCDRDRAFGWKRGGRWFVSISKMRARLNMK